MIRWFIQKENIGILAQDLGEGGLKPLTAAEVLESLDDLGYKAQTNIFRSMNSPASRLDLTLNYPKEGGFSTAIAAHKGNATARADLGTKSLEAGFIGQRKA